MDVEIDWIKLASTKLRSSLDRRRFTALFGLQHPVLHLVWDKVGHSFRNERLRPLSLLWLLYWFKIYPTDDVCAATWHVDSKTFVYHRNVALALLYDKLDVVRPEIHSVRKIRNSYRISSDNSQIHWSDRFLNFIPETGLFAHHTFSVDVTECRISRPNDKNMERLLWSGKAKFPSLKYEGSQYVVKHSLLSG